MQLRTYTGLWNVEKRLYKFYDINLPYSISVKQLGIFVGSAALWMGLLAIVRFPFESPWHLVWLAPPAAITYFAGKTVTEGKTLFDFALSQIRFFFGRKTYVDLTPETEPEGTRAVVTARAWRRY
jgi:hypothetical protein